MIVVSPDVFNAYRPSAVPAIPARICWLLSGLIAIVEIDSDGNVSVRGVQVGLALRAFVVFQTPPLTPPAYSVLPVMSLKSGASAEIAPMTLPEVMLDTWPPLTLFGPASAQIGLFVIVTAGVRRSSSCSRGRGIQRVKLGDFLEVLATCLRAVLRSMAVVPGRECKIKQ